MNPLAPVVQRWKTILVVVVVVTIAVYFGARQLPHKYTSTTLVQIVLSSEQTGAYVDSTTLEELTNVYLEVGQSSSILRAAALASGIPESDLQSSVVVSVAEPGVLAFAATDASSKVAARYANATAGAFSNAIATTSAAQRQARVSALTAQLATLQTELHRLPANSPSTATVLSEISTVQSNIAAINATPGNSADLINEAQPSSSPSSPNPKKDALLAFVLALVLAPALTYAASWLRRSYTSPLQVTEDLGLPVLAVVPKMDTADERPDEAMHLIHISTQLGAEQTLNDDSAAAVVVFASATPGDGKTFVTRSMFASLRESGTPAIFIDGDLYKGDLSATQSTNGNVDLSEILADPAKLTEFTDRAQRLDDSGAEGAVRLIGVAPGERERIGLLGGTALDSAMRQIIGVGMPVYVDTPALLSRSDGLVFARYATDVLLVIHSRRTRRSDAAEAVRRLRSVGAPISGVVFNWATKETPYAYGSYYGYYGRPQQEGSSVASSPGPRDRAPEPQA